MKRGFIISSNSCHTSKRQHGRRLCPLLFPPVKQGQEGKGTREMPADIDVMQAKGVMTSKEHLMFPPDRYSSLSDKAKFVDNISFGNTCTELLDKLKQLSAEGYFFRGQRDALWPIVSSGQRTYVEYIKKCFNSPLCFGEFLQSALAYAKNEREFLPKMVECRRRDCKRNHYDHEIWGWLQHYSYPTPFIDFSREYRVALYMATAKIDNPYDNGHFSIYAIPGHFESGSNEIVRLEALLKSELSECGMREESMFAFDMWKDFKFLLVHKDGSLKPWDKNLAKRRIASQDGLFVYLRDADVSLEKYLFQQSKMIDGEDGEGCILPRIKCVDIPNSIAPLVREFCRGEGYTAEYLGLADKTKDICMQCIKQRFLESSCKNSR